jgi:hypothetical protein
MKHLTLAEREEFKRLYGNTKLFGADVILGLIDQVEGLEKRIEAMRPHLLPLEDYINEPDRSCGQDGYESMYVCDYRHKLYPKWSKLRDLIQAAITQEQERG